MAFETKYFVLKPKSRFKDDPFAIASRAGMREFAETIKDTDDELASELLAWCDREEFNNMKMPDKMMDSDLLKQLLISQGQAIDANTQLNTLNKILLAKLQEMSDEGTKKAD